MLEFCFNALCSEFKQRFARYRQCTNSKCLKSYKKQNNNSSSYLLKRSLLVNVLVVKSRQQTGERCSGVFPAPVCSPCQRCCLSAPHRAAAAHRGQTERPHQRRREGARWGGLHGSEARVSDLRLQRDSRGEPITRGARRAKRDQADR